VTDKRAEAVERFYKHVDRQHPDLCWPWTGPTTQKRGKVSTYGRVYIGNGKFIGAHRMAYLIFNGPIGKGLVIDHLCRYGLCCNPRHLETVTQKENTLRGIGPTSVNHYKESCSKGHPYKNNSRVNKLGYRICLPCKRAYDRIWKRRRRNERAVLLQRYKLFN